MRRVKPSDGAGHTRTHSESGWQSSPGPGEKLRPWAVSGCGGGKKEAAGTCTPS